MSPHFRKIVHKKELLGGSLDTSRHGKGFNFLFCDGHVTLVKRQDFLDLRKTGPNWNNDHEPHIPIDFVLPGY